MCPCLCRCLISAARSQGWLISPWSAAPRGSRAGPRIWGCVRAGRGAGPQECHQSPRPRGRSPVSKRPPAAQRGCQPREGQPVPTRSGLCLSRVRNSTEPPCLLLSRNVPLPSACPPAPSTTIPPLLPGRTRPSHRPKCAEASVAHRRGRGIQGALWDESRLRVCRRRCPWVLKLRPHRTNSQLTEWWLHESKGQLAQYKWCRENLDPQPQVRMEIPEAAAEAGVALQS